MVKVDPTWRMYHDNVAVSKGDRGRLMWKVEYDNDYENVDKKEQCRCGE